MSIWQKNIGTKDIERSAKLCKQRDQLAAKRQKIMDDWNQLDENEVLPAAREFSIVLHSNSPERILQARKDLQQAISKRDEQKDKFNRELETIELEVELINNPVILQKSQEWQAELLGLRARRLFEVESKSVDLSKEYAPRTIFLRSNFKALGRAKESLLDGIKELRGMHSRPLAEIYQFIETTEAKLKKIDLNSIEVSDEPISVQSYRDIVDEPNLQIVDPRSTMSRFFRQ